MSSRCKDLITVLVWYATEGHVNGRNGGIVITQANRDELERVRAAYARITTGKGSIDAGAKTDSAWRLYLGSQAIARLVTHHCGELSRNKRLPDFLFRLPTAYLQHAFDELMRTDGSRKLSTLLDETACDDYREKFFDYKTISPMLAAQVGTLATLLGLDYAVFMLPREGKAPAYRVRFVSGSGKRGGRHTSFEARLHERDGRGRVDLRHRVRRDAQLRLAASATSSAATPTSRNIGVSRTTSSWRRSATARSRSTCPTSPGCATRSASTRRTSTPSASRASTSPRTPSRSRPCGRS